MSEYPGLEFALPSPPPHNVFPNLTLDGGSSVSFNPYGFNYKAGESSLLS